MSNNKFIVIEGIDRSGKTTITKYIAEYINNATRISFPNRESVTGKIIDSYLKNNVNLNPQTIHLLFSANRWEMKKEIENMLTKGSVVCDRYFYSGIAYSIANGLDIEWCNKPDAGLRKPDLVIFLDIKPKNVQQRSGFGDEKYEKAEHLEKVYLALKNLVENDTNGCVVDANCSVSELKQRIVKIINSKC
ncbi:hypothetical protein BDAP_000068 [Binucleata daphniae]